MSLTDCPKCWDAMCCCGYEYRDWSVARLREQIAMLQRVLNDKAAMTDAQIEAQIISTLPTTDQTVAEWVYGRPTCWGDERFIAAHHRVREVGERMIADGRIVRHQDHNGGTVVWADRTFTLTWPTKPAALGSPETPRDLLDECVPRLLELLRNAGITEPDELKHRLEDHDRWRKDLLAVSPQEDAAQPVSLWGADFPALVRDAMAKGDKARRLKLAEALRREADILSEPPSLLAVPEGRLRELAQQKMLADHIYAIECGPLKGHVDNRDDEDVRFGFDACPHPDCVLVRTPLASVSHPDVTTKTKP